MSQHVVQTVLTVRVRFRCMAPKKRDAKFDSKVLHQIKDFFRQHLLLLFEVSRCKRECWRQSCSQWPVFWFFNSALQGLRRSAFDSIPQSFHSVVFCGTNGLSSQVCMWSLCCKGPRFTNCDRFGWSAIHSTKFVSVKRIMHFQFWKCCWQEKHQIFSCLCHLPRKMLQR